MDESIAVIAEAIFGKFSENGFTKSKDAEIIGS